MSLRETLPPAIRRALRRGRDRFFARWFLPVSQETLPPHVTHLPNGRFGSFGDSHPETVFYVIWRARLGSGFFSNFAQTLGHLIIADSLGMTPVVDWRNFPTLYNEQEPVNGTDNAWEYYFDQVGNNTLAEVYQSRHVFFCDGTFPRDCAYNMTAMTGAARVFDRYVSIRPDVEATVGYWVDQLGVRPLGVHLRGQEMNRAAGHPFGPTVRQAIRAVREMIRQGAFDSLFLVTEEQQFVDVFRREFGDMVLVTNSWRTYSENAYKSYPRPRHKYLLGREVLVDALVLSRCVGLLASGSNVSEFARFCNRGRYDLCWRIWNGTNSTNALVALYLYEVRRRLPQQLGGLPGKIVPS